MTVFVIFETTATQRFKLSLSETRPGVKSWWGIALIGRDGMGWNGKSRVRRRPFSSLPFPSLFWVPPLHLSLCSASRLPVSPDPDPSIRDLRILLIYSLWPGFCFSASESDSVPGPRSLPALHQRPQCTVPFPIFVDPQFSWAQESMYVPRTLDQRLKTRIP